MRDDISWKDLCEFLPESVIAYILRQSLDKIRDNLRKSTKVEDSLLASFFHPKDGDTGYNYLAQCAKLLSRRTNSKDHVRIKYFYDPTPVNFPSIHFNLPAMESGVNQTLGFGAGSSDQYSFDPADSERSPSFAREVRPTYDIMVVSDNQLEVLCLSHLLHSIFISFSEWFTTAMSYNNLVISLNDLQLPEDNNKASTLYARAVRISFSFEKRVSSPLVEQVMKDLTVKGSVGYIEP